MALRYILTSLALLAALPAMAENEIGEVVSIELNAAKTNDGACTLTFVVLNGHSAQIDHAVYETVLFDASGQVDRLTLFDMGALPAARQRVRQFSVSGVTCEALGSILFNGADTCTGEGLPEAACESGLMLSTRTDIEVKG
ncbi:hypothetical protein [Roseovarius sp. Pro17]|uniref:hypothetical protein n=1 Tax=Roseovarius sp. Pro17 TaxID=3108175 RepID=UPI002D78C783|nr:hypothetical protein [Roseovarius sp. Pro17]